MSSSRKPLAIALTVVIMLAMLVPAAMAAPEWVHGVNITFRPKSLRPMSILWSRASTPYVEVQGDKGFTTSSSILPTQVDDILVTIRVVDANNHVAVWTYDYVVASTGLTAAQTSAFLVPMASDGWYDLQVCVRDLNNAPGRPRRPATSSAMKRRTQCSSTSAKPGAAADQAGGWGRGQRRLSDGRQGLGSLVGLERSVHAVRWRHGNLVRLLRVHQLAAGRMAGAGRMTRAGSGSAPEPRPQLCRARAGSTSSPGTRPRCLTTMVLFGSAPWTMSSSRPAMWRRSSW